MKLIQVARNLAVAGVLLATAATSRAALVSYTPTGVFTTGATPGTNVFTGAGTSPAVLFFTGTPGTLVGTPSNVTFGQFNTGATTSIGNATVTSPFTLTITQTAPTGGTGSFSAALNGTLSVSSTSAYIQFAAPLSITVGGVQYAIAENDGGIAGRLNLAPPSTGGVVSLIGTVTAVPEPVTLVGLAAAPALLMARRRKA